MHDGRNPYDVSIEPVQDAVWRNDDFAILRVAALRDNPPHVRKQLELPRCLSDPRRHQSGSLRRLLVDEAPNSPKICLGLI